MKYALRICSIAGVLLICSTIFAQKDLKTNAFYIEIGGEGIGLSANLDYRFKPNFSARIGFSFAVLGYGVPISLSYISNPYSSSHFEGGLGITYGEFASLWGGGTTSILLPYILIGYRYQPADGGFIFRLTGIAGPSIALVGISLGYCY